MAFEYSLHTISPRNRTVVAVVRLFTVLLLIAGGLGAARSAEEDLAEVSLDRLFAGFSDPARGGESDRLLDEILRRLSALAASQQFAKGEHYLRQLESARIGRTFSLFRSPEKQDQDAQLFRIRKFIAGFYEAHAEFERKRGLTVEAESLRPVRYLEAIERTKKWLGKRPESELPCFEDDQASLPFRDSARASKLVMIPTTFFIGLPGGGCPGLPPTSPFSFLPSDGPVVDVALDPGWSWSLTNMQGSSRTLVAGMSPTGAQLIWLAGPLADNRSLSITNVGGRWVIVAGDPVVEGSSGYSLLGARPPSIPSGKNLEPLKSRGMAGFVFRGLRKEDVASFSKAPTEGVLIRDVFPGSPAREAGLEPGDILLEYDGVILTGESRLYDIIRTKLAGEEVPFCVWRQGRQIRKSLKLGEAPPEQAADLDIEYTDFPSGGVRLRAVLVSPKGVVGKKLPGLFIVSALGSPRLRSSPVPDPLREVAYETARKGWRVLRFEQRGSGDSEGQDFRTTDFETERADNQAGLEYLLQRPDLDSSRVFVFGHSTGGIIAALLARARPVAGLIVSGTWGRSFFERVLATIRLQGTLKGDPAVTIDRSVKEFLAIFSELMTDRPLEQILKERPQLARFVNAGGRLMDDRTATYWHQKLNLNLAEIYAEIRCPTLILYNACDFIITRACHEWIRDVMANAGNRDVTLRIVEHADHHFLRVEDFADSFRVYGTGTGTFNPEPFQVITGWLETHAGP